MVLINQDDSTAIVYEPGVSATSVLTPFCVSCHDSDGATVYATSLIPFSDGLTRPFVDETEWYASSHKGSGSAECADCHEVHGSEKVNLFTPGDLAPDPTTKTEEEEGFCFSCHDSGGPASFDLATDFALPINWVQTPRD